MYEALHHVDRRPEPGAARLLRVVKGPLEPLSADEQRRFLLEVAATRDWQAFARLFQHFAPRLKTYYLRSSTPAGLADDLVQDVLMSVWRKASTFNPKRASVSTWVFTIARNTRIDHHRRQRDPATLPYEPQEAPASQETVILGAESEGQVLRALGSLSADQREVMYLTYFSERSQTEIATELQIPLGTVKSRARLALKRLRSFLEEEEEHRAPGQGNYKGEEHRAPGQGKDKGDAE